MIESSPVRTAMLAMAQMCDGSVPYTVTDDINSPPLGFHAVATLEPLVLALAKVRVLEDAVPFLNELFARELPEVP